MTGTVVVVEGASVVVEAPVVLVVLLVGAVVVVLVCCPGAPARPVGMSSSSTISATSSARTAIWSAGHVQGHGCVDELDTDDTKP
ncbi:MAG: hypothetical protein ACR2KK_15130 [Acidimicrobiales bacterium]